MSIKRSVVLRGDPEFNEYGVANEAIKPGYLVKGVSAVAKQTASGKAPKNVAVERDELGAGFDDTYFDAQSGVKHAAYASGDTIKVASFDAGDEATLFIASGQNISEDDYLQSAGDGTVAKTTNVSSGAMCRALESSGGAVALDTAIRVQFV